MTRSYDRGRSDSGRRREQPGRSPAAPANKEPIPCTKIDIKLRGTALAIDVLVASFLGSLVSFICFIFLRGIPQATSLVPTQLLVVGFLLVKDWFFQGRGIGKNLLGLKVVTFGGLPPTLTQCIKRNIVFWAPFLILQILQIILAFSPIPWLTQAVLQLFTAASTVYVLIVLPLEAWRASESPDGRRFGDQFAGTGLAESTMDFSHFFGR